VEDTDDDAETLLSDSVSVLMAPDKAWMNAPDLRDRAEALEPPQPGRVWTDDFNNIVSAVRPGGTTR
jgi:hypothetical protein